MDSTEDLVRIFNSELGEHHNVCLLGGAPEPLYLPVGPDRQTAEIHFREDFASSALHELAHWCLAGEKRRQLEDYGYWYESTRDESQQRRFEAVEARPQAAEWILSVAAGLRFRISSDNFQIEELDVKPFQRCVHSNVHLMLKDGVPVRVKSLAIALATRMPGGDTGFSSAVHYQKLPEK